jgi:hypothetical protein
MKYKNVVTTLFENHYEYGVAALINSLYKADFEGLISIGYKGNLPFWINQLSSFKGNDNIYQLSEKIDLRFDELNVDMHLGYYKPYYLKRLAQEFPEAQGWFYFDPDIVVLAKWSFYEKWIKSGVALCQDSNYTLLYWNHPWRNQWRTDFSEFDKGIDKSLNWYINSGFIGVNFENFELINRWIEVNEKYKVLGYPIHFFDKGQGIYAYKGDQDVLNAAMTLSQDLRYSIIGKEAMAFDYPAGIMVHAVTGVKPWKINYIKNAFSGNKPTVIDESFLHFCFGPIEVYTRAELSKKTTLLKISKVINRIWKK